MMSKRIVSLLLALMLVCAGVVALAADEYQITFSPNGGSGEMAGATVSAGGSYTLPNCSFTAPDGKVFKHWMANGFPKIMPEETITVNSDLTILPYWMDSQYTIVLDPNLGDGKTYPYTYQYDEELYLPNGEEEDLPFTMPEGKIIWNWVLLENGDDFEPGLSYSGHNGMVFRADWADAEWSENNHSVKLVVGEWSEERISPVGTEFMLPYLRALPCRDHFGESAWIDHWTVDGVKYAPGSRLVLEQDTVATATLGEESTAVYMVTFNANGGSGSRMPIEASSGTTIVLPENPFTAPEGMRFKAWSIDDAEYNAGAWITVTGDMTITAVWEEGPEYCTITFEANGASGTMEPVTVAYGSEYVLPQCEFSAPAFAQRVFSCWRVNGGSEYAAGDTITVTGDTTLMALWREKYTYTVSFDANGGSGEIEPQTITEGSLLYLPKEGFTAPEGKRLKGWSVNGTEYAPGEWINVSSDITAIAVWEDAPEYCTVSFDANGGSGAMEATTVGYGSKYGLPECTFIAPEGKKFLGWTIDGVSNYYLPASVTIEYDTVFKAVWMNQTDYTVKLDPNGGTGDILCRTFSQNTLFRFYTLPDCDFGAPEGMQFKAWSVNGKEYAPGATINVNSNLTVKAVWFDKSQYRTVKFEGNGASGSMAEQFVPYGSNYVLPACTFTAPTGMAFRAWSIDGTEYAAGAPITVMGDMTLTAMWDTSVTITYDLNGYTELFGNSTTKRTAVRGSSYQLLMQNYVGLPVSVTSVVRLTGWLIDGQLYSPGQTITVTGDMTAVAQWEKIVYSVVYQDSDGQVLKTIEDIEPNSQHTILTLEELGISAPEGYQFKAWNVNGREYAVGESFAVSGQMTVKVVWEQIRYNVDWIFNGAMDGEGRTELNGSAPMNWLLTLPHPVDSFGVTPPEGQQFKAWSVNGVEYQPGESITITDNTAVTAIWKAIEYTVTYNPGRGTGEIKTETATAGVQFPLINPAQLGYAAPEGEAFKAWSVEGVEHGMFDFINVTKDITVTALWEAGECTVSFDANGGSGTMEPVTIAKGADFEIPACGFFAPLGKQFKAWELDGFELKPDDVINPIYDETLKAIWEDAPEVNYTITFDANGGEGTMEDVTWQAGTYYLPWCTFEREGHNFAGWLVNGEGEPMDAYDTITLSSDIELVATWDPHVYTIHFSAGIGEDGNNSAGANLDKTYGVGFTLPDPNELGFTCEHHEFIGWTDETNGPSENAKFYAKGAEFVPKSFTILVAQWEPLKYKVSFNPGEGGTGEMADGVATYGFPYSLPECTFTAPEGHEFKAWLMNGREVPEGNSLLAEEDTIITAVWEPKTYTITYDLNGMTGSGYGPVEIKYGETHNLRDPEGIEIPENMHFDGWQVGEDKYGPNHPLTVTGDTTVIAQWKERLVSLTYLDDEGNEIKKFADLKYGSDHTELKPEELKLTAPEGYEFNCWLVLNTRHEVIGEQNPYDTVPMKVFSNWLMQANWVKKTQQYTLTLDMNGGDPIEGYSVYEGAYFELPRPEVISHPKEFEFDYFDIGDGNKYYPGDYILATADVTAKAIWMAPAAVEYTITYDANGGKGEMVPQTVIEGVEQGLSANLFGRPGYTFAGWNTAADGSGTAYAADATIVPTTDVTLYAQWTAIPYTITFDGGDAPGSMDSVTKLFGETYVLPECGFQSPINNRFKAWDVNGTEYAVGDTITVTGDVTVKPVWEWISYTVTFDAQGGTGAMEPLSVLAGTSINAPLCGFTAPEGMLFEAWHVDDELYADSYKVGDEIVVYGDVTLKAGWTKSEYKVTYKSSDAQDARIYEDPIAVGSAYKLLDNMFTAPEGKQFRCWLFPVPPTFTETEELDPGTEFSSVSADLTFIADWEAIECSVSFDANGGSGAMEAETVEYGTDYVLPDCTFTAPEGKEFVAWEIDGVRYLPDDSVIIKGGVTVKAVWSVQALAVSFEGGEYGSGNMASEMASYGEPYTLPSCGYSYPSESVVFIGWKLGGTYYAPGDEVVLYEDTTFTAMWADRWYTFSFVDSYDNSVKASKTIEYGQRLTLGNPADYGMAAKEYHMFAHWDVGGTAYAPGDSIRYSANKTVKAMWTFDNSVETIVVETPVELKPEMTEEELNKVLEEVFDDVVATVPSIETPAQIVEEIEEAVPAGYEPESMTLQNVELMFKPAGSDTWIKATEENFPTTGILHTLDFTEGTSAATHDYKILHMIVTGDKAGTVEEIEPEVVDENGVTGRFYSLSPISVVHKLKPVEETIPDGALELLPETGDPSSLIGWITLLGASGVSLRAIKRRKK